MPFRPIFAFFLFIGLLLMISLYLGTKLGVFYFAHSIDTDGTQKSKVGHVIYVTHLFNLILDFFVVLLVFNESLHQK